MERVLELYQPHPGQMQFHESHARFRIAATGRQFGKSTMSLNEIAFKAWERPSGKFWFISPIFSQAKDQFRRFIKMMPPEVIKRYSESELRIELINEAEIEFKSGETLDNLRGASLHGVVIDEVRDQHAELWPMVIRPMLTTTKGWAIFVSTPNGFDSFYDLFDRGKNDPDWFCMHAPSDSNPMFSQDEKEAARATMSEDEFAQEIMAEFRSIGTGKVYRNEGAHNHAMVSPFCYDGELVSPYLPVVLGMDFNVRPCAWAMGQHRNGEWYWFDEIFVSDTNTMEMSEELIYRLMSLKERGRLKGTPQVIICGDASGKSRNTKATETDYSIICNALSAAGITFSNSTPESNPPIKARVNSVNCKLKAADGSVSFWYHPINCKRIKRDLERVSWKAGAQMILDQTTDSSLTHISDAVGYPVHELSPIGSFGSVGISRVIKRT